MMNTHIVIMAGGVGSRFWPMSTPECPKQFIDVLGCGRTLLQLTYDRFVGVALPEHIWVVTSKRYAAFVREQLPEIPQENILLEPCMRNTAPCIAYVAWKIQARHTEANVVVTPADHVVMNIPEFRRVVEKSLLATRAKGEIVTLGIKPLRPETGYGYIAAGEVIDELAPVLAFKEKPVIDIARGYLAAGNYYWNSGVFIWQVKSIEAAIRTYQPALADRFDALTPSFYTPAEQAEIDTYFPLCESISIDYAVMEKAQGIRVFPAEFGWSDLGTWGSLHQLLPHDDHQNGCVGQVSLIESSHCVVHLPPHKRVVLQGLDGYIVAENNDTLLVCRLQDEQRIKEFSNSITL